MKTTTLFSLFESKEEKMAEELVADGMENFKDGDYNDALKLFEKLKAMYPFSKYAILAELKIADSYYNLGKYEEAVFAYEEFRELHPQNEAIPYVIYKKGMCYFDRIDAPDRDQASAENAIAIFNELMKKYPKSLYAKKAEKFIAKSLKNIAEHELYVGNFYFKSKHYKAALNRFKNIVINYPDAGEHHKAIQHIAECEDKIENDKE